MQKILTGLAVGAALVMGLQANADAQMRTSKPAATQTVYSSETAPANNMLGIGYKLGNGIGLTGADLIVNPISNLSLDLQIATMEGVLGFAPALQYHLDPAGGPYVGLGYQRASATVEGQTTAANGVFGNVGWQWKPLTNLGVQFGVGYQKLIDGTQDGGLNFEFGTRYFFL